ncbi:MAG TPA: ABC transporter permease [Symbiobacteriaceae bacterium]|nr:ABC transporter permease [Symbiobacteriaceae bacterium]
MDLVWDGLQEALRMLVAGDPELLRITWLTLRVSGSATLISLLLGVPVGLLLGLARFPGRTLVASLVNAGMGLPPVVVGLWVSIFLWRSGPLGFLEAMYTPAAMVVAQVTIAAPKVAGLTMAGILQLNPKLYLQVQALGANRRQAYWLLIREARFSILAAIMAGFGAVIAEVGASMMVGGNLEGYTRVLSTAMVWLVNKGDFDVAIALSLILMLLAYAVTATLTILQHRRRAL